MIKSLSGWANATIGDVAEVSTGSTPKRTESKYWENADIPWLTSSVTGKPICKSATQFVSSLAVKECRLKTFSKGTLLLAMYGEGKTRGQVTEIKIDATCNQACAAIAVDSQLASKEFVKYRLLENYQATRLAAAGGNQPNLNLNKVRAIITPLAPLKEQKRIVEKLDSLLAQVDTIQQRLNNLPDIIKRFRQSVLAAAVSGKLTEQWRGMNSETVTSAKVLEEHKQRWCETKLKEFKEKNKLPKNDSWKSKYKLPEAVETDKCWALPNQWTWATIDSISFVTKLAGFEYTKFVEYSDDGNLPVIKAENVGLNGFRHKRYSHVFSDKVEHLTRSKILGDEILVVFVGAGVGQVGVVPSDKEYFLGPNVAMVKNVSNLYLTEYMEMYLRSLVGKELMLSFSKGAAQPSLSMGQIRKTSVPLPSLKEQTEIVRLVEQYFALADTLEKNLANAKQRVDNLTQSILAKAFRGELVPQDPNDEPADKLLARIKAAQLEAEKLEKAAKKAAKASKK